MKSETQIIKGCAKGQMAAQYELVKRYSAMLMTVCRRYASDNESAKDILQEAYIRIFKNIHKYQSTGSFEAWMRRIVIRCALNWTKLNANRIFSSSVEIEDDRENNRENILDQLGNEGLIKLIQNLPSGFRAVFNLYSIEGYSHKEIAELLGIKESASRSQLTRARALLRTQVKQMESIKFPTS